MKCTYLSNKKDEEHAYLINIALDILCLIIIQATIRQISFFVIQINVYTSNNKGRFQNTGKHLSLFFTDILFDD